MDPVSHCLLGNAFASFSPRQSVVPGRRAAFILGSIAPDIDILIAPAGWDRYLLIHEVGTHTVALAPVLALAAAAIISPFVPGARVRRVFWPALLGVVIGHLFFDLVSGSDMRLFEPFWTGRIGLHWIAMGDVLALGILAAGAVATLWRPRPAAAVMIVALSVLLIAKAWSQQRARSTLETGHGSVAGHPEAVGGAVCKWLFFDRDVDRVGAWHVDACTGAIGRAFTWTDATGDLVQTSKQAPVVQALLAFAHVPFARIEHQDGRVLVLWSDLRHCSEVTCHLSFGVELDESLRPRRQLVRIGPVEQWRSIE
ncbi:MAG TPA: metal-dependent hydrolase [Vicinamibacterales bacterium]|nr:metal-dependent hydrolase [Vicinamibacterales bacterium]